MRLRQRRHAACRSQLHGRVGVLQAEHHQRQQLIQLARQVGVHRWRQHSQNMQSLHRSLQVCRCRLCLHGRQRCCCLLPQLRQPLLQRRPCLPCHGPERCLAASPCQCQRLRRQLLLLLCPSGRRRPLASPAVAAILSTAVAPVGCPLKPLDLCLQVWRRRRARDRAWVTAGKAAHVFDDPAGRCREYPVGSKNGWQCTQQMAG